MSTHNLCFGAKIRKICIPTPAYPSFYAPNFEEVEGAFFMPPTSKKLRGHIGLGLSVQSSPVQSSGVQWCAVCDA